jgi:parallel beta-helix repeat protein
MQGKLASVMIFLILVGTTILAHNVQPVNSDSTEVSFLGTALNYFSADIPGGAWGWNVTVDNVTSGPIEQGDVVSVSLQAVSPPVGYMDPSIQSGSKVAVYGSYDGENQVSLVGSAEYYIGVAWTEIIYIRADGSIDPPTAPISTSDNITYTLVGNITSDADGIVVEKSNIIMNGADYTLQGTGAYFSKGVSLSERSNVTIRNIKIKAFEVGIEVYRSSNATISGNNITKNGWYGVYLYQSSNNTILENNITGSEGYTDSKGVCLESSSSNNSIVKNVITENQEGGVLLSGSSNNIISENSVTDNGGWGIEIADFYGLPSNNNEIIGNNVSRNGSGIRLCYSSYDVIIANTLTNNSYKGLQMEASSINTLKDNHITGSEQSFGVWSYEAVLSSCIHDVDASNTVNGKPIYYLVSQKGLIIDSIDIGYLALVNCTDIYVKNVILRDNGQGLLLAFTTNSTIENVNVTHNANGVQVLRSNGNTIINSTITDTTYRGISLYYASSNSITKNTIRKAGISIGILVKAPGWFSIGGNNPCENNTISCNIISNNTGSMLEGGIVLASSGTKYNSISHNTLLGNYLGLNILYNASDNKIYHNSFVDNKKQGYIDITQGTGVNVWDDGYPSGGNYWSDYNRTGN